MARNLEKRLAQVERKLADIQTEIALANCICKGVTIVWSNEEFEAEKNRRCPAHGNRQDKFIRIMMEDEKGQEITKENRPRPEVGKPCTLSDLRK